MSTVRRFARVTLFVVAALALTAAAAHAQQFQLINSFVGCPEGGCAPGADAAHPASLARGPDGRIYGTSEIDWRTGEAAPRDWGTVFRIEDDGSRVVLHRFAGAGPGECGTSRVTFGTDGALYGMGSACPSTRPTIYRISAGDFSTLGEYDGPGVPLSLVAGSNGAFYGVTDGGSAFYLFKWSETFTLIASYAYEGFSGYRLGDLVLAPDGRIYFPTRFNHGFIDIHLGSISRITATDQVETAVSFDGLADQLQPRNELLVGSDGHLYGTAQRNFGGDPILYRLTLPGTLSTVPGYAGGTLLAVGPDGSFYLSTGEGGHDGIARLTAAGDAVPVHTFDGTDGSGALPALARAADGHLYGVRTDGGEHSLGVLYRIRLPKVDMKANGADGPVLVNAGQALQIAMGFDAAGDALSPSEVYLAVVTPALQIIWTTPGGFSLTPAPIYSGPLPSFPSTSLINIPDAAVMPAGDYYWVAIVDADANGIPNGHYVDFVKTTRAAATAALQRRR